MDQREVEAELRRLARAKCAAGQKMLTVDRRVAQAEATGLTQAADLVRDAAAGWEKRSPAGEARLRGAVLALDPLLRVLELEAVHARRVNADTLSTPARWEPSEAFMAPLRQAISIALQVKQ